MTDRSPRLGLPLLAAGQAQKELFHNESLILLDALAHASVVAAGANHPPAEPDEGQAWILGESPEGAWAGNAGAIAFWSAGGWSFVAPREGMCAWVEEAGVEARFHGGGWHRGEVDAAEVRVSGVKVVGEQAPAIGDPSGGAFADAEARTAIRALLTALRSHGLIAS